MPQANLRNSGLDPYLYLEGNSGSTAVGLVGATDIFNIVVVPSASDIEPDSGTPSISIDPAFNGNISFQPKGTTGSSIFINGDVSITANSGGGPGTGLGNLNMEDTALNGDVGVINYSGNRFIHNAGTDNTFIGSLAGNLGTTGNSSVAVGANALDNDTSLVGMTAVGFDALTNLSAGIQNTAVGYRALASATSANQNTAVGYNALPALTSPGIGGGLNAAFGNSALGSSTLGRFNTAIGCQALNALNGNGTNDIFNTAVGLQAGWLMTSGVENTLIGAQAGYNEATGLLTGNANVLIGYRAGGSYTGAESNNIIIGKNAGTVGDSARIRIGTQGTQTSCFIAGITGTTLGAPVGVVNIDASGQLGVGSSGGGFTWSVITADQTAAVNNGYICNKGSALLLALPATSAVGDVIEVTGINTALGWRVTQSANQQVFFGTTSSTLGATGFLQSTAIRDSIKMVCVVANLTWNVVSSVGNINIT